MWDVVTPTFTHKVTYAHAINYLTPHIQTHIKETWYSSRQPLIMVKRCLEANIQEHAYIRTHRKLYLVSVLPFLYIFHVQHVADYLEEFLDTRRSTQLLMHQGH